MITPTSRAALGWIALAALGLASQSGVKLAIVNESPSLPRGLYLRSPGAPVRSGSIVALPAPSGARAYLARLGFPPNILLLKRVAGQEGDLVCVTAGELFTSQRVLPVRDHDRHGRALPLWRGCALLAAGEVFLLGDTDDSFDSRYFGPVRAADLKGVFWEAATW
jgi:conjugative transfer signal peptidase TraF